LPGALGCPGGGAGLAGAVGVGVGAGPDAARVVGVDAAGPEVPVVGPGVAALRAVVAVVLDGAAGPVAPDWAAAPVVAVVSAAAAVVEVVELGPPVAANWPPRRKEGGPLWVSL